MLGDSFFKSFEDRWLNILSRGGEIQKSMNKRTGDIINKDLDSQIKKLNSSTEAKMFLEMLKKYEGK